VVGHSAGGQLALWIAARPKLPADSPVHTNDALPVKAVVDIDGPPDLESAYP
jgi:acetyl esterase/lipase